MTLSNNAIKFLQAQYRAIFKRAYIKGLATAVLLTAGLAAGQAQANPNDLATSWESGDALETSTADDIFKKDSATVGGIIINAGDKLTTSGSIISNGAMTSHGNLTIESGSILLAEKETVGDNANQTIYRYDFTSNGGDITMTGNIGAASFSISGGTLVLKSGGDGNTNLTAYGSGWNQDQTSGNATNYDRNTANGELLNTTVTVNAGTNVAALNLLKVDNSTITLSGTGSSGSVADANTAYLEGSRHIDISDSTINVSGYANGIFSKNGSISDSEITIAEGAKLLIAGNADDYTAVLSGSAQASGATYSLTNTDITNAGTLQLGTSGSNDFTITGGSMNNTGTVIVNADELSVTDEYFNGLFTKGTGDTQGKLNFSGSAINVDGAVDLNGLGIIDSSNGSLDSNRLGLKADGATLTTDTVSLKGFYTADKLDLDVDTLKVEGTPQGSSDPKKIRFEMASGTTITVHDALTGSNTIEQFVIKATDASANTSLILDAGANGGKITNIENFHVGWDNSGSSVLFVKGTWDFGGSVIKAGSGGTVTIDGTANNVGELRLQEGGDTVVNGTMEIGRLLATTAGDSTLDINGTLTITGDGKADKGQSNYSNDVQLTEATVNINNGGTLAITKADALDDFLTVTKNDSGAITGITVSASGDKTTDIGGWSGDKVNLKAGGTLSLNLADLGVTSLTSTQLKELKGDLVSDSSSGGSFDFGEGFTVDLSDNEALQNQITSGSVSYSDLVSAGVNDIQGVTKDATVVVDSGTAASGITLSNGATAVELTGTDTVKANSLVLNNTTGGNFVYTTNASGDKVAANVAVTTDGAVNLAGNGTVGSLTKASGATGTSAELTAGQNATQTVQGSIDLDEVTIGAGSVNVTQSVTAGELTVNGTLKVADGSGDVAITTTSGATIAGTLNAGAVTSSGNMTITGSVLANSIVLSGSADSLSVGDSSSSGLVEVETLDLNNGTLLIDPDWTQDASFVAVTTPAQDVVNVNGSIGVGQNSVGVFGATAAEAQESLNRLGLLQAGKLDAQGIGAALYLDDTLQIASEKHVLVDKNKDNSGLSTDLTGLTGSGSVTLREGSALVISESFSNELVDDQNKAIFEFAATTGTVSVTAESGAQIIFDSADILGDDTVTVATKASNSTATITTTLDNAEITAAGGLLEGKANGNTISFSLAQNAADLLYNQSNPIRDMTLDVVRNQNGTYDSADAGVNYIGAMNAHNGGTDIERTARMALYGGAVQATLMAQQTSTDAISERLGMANPNSALITSNNAQGGGLWLSPVYKNHDSDEFEAEGVNYGADIDLYGLALGADFTTESGVRVGAMFNVGSGDAEGQGIGEGVSNDFDYYGFSLYAGVTFGNFALTADAGFTQVSNDLEQAVNYHGVGTLKADTDTQTVSVGVRGEYLFATPWVDVVPHVGVRYTSFDMDSYQAQVDGYTIANADADSMQVFSIPFGVTFSKDMAMGNWVVKPVFDLNLTANAGDDELESDVAFVGVSNVALTTEVMDSFTYGATLGVSAQYQESFSFGLNVGYTGSSSADEFGVNANARYTF